MYVCMHACILMYTCMHTYIHVCMYACIPKEFRPHPIGVRGGRGAPSLGSRVSQAGRLFERPVYIGVGRARTWAFKIRKRRFLED